MKKRYFIIGMVIAFAIEIIGLVVFAVHAPDDKQNAVEVNAVVKTVAADFYGMKEHRNPGTLDYAVLDNDGTVVYATRSGLSESENAAIIHRDTVLDVERDGVRVGKVIIYNDSAQKLQEQKRTAIAVIAAAMAVECAICIGYGLYLYTSVIKPFKKLKGFAERIACGNLDIPLEMDRNNLFGAFTESFDIMRSELKKARIAEADAERSKKELVAKLSHDIKTPVASIKAVAEVGLAVSKRGKHRENYAQIIGKTDQINALVTNLFTSTLEELHELAVTPENIDSRRVKRMIETADYLHRAEIPDIPDCLIYADPLRLQQVFDNVFANSYKYANTKIAVAPRLDGDRVEIVIEDQGGGVSDDELPVLKEKFKRGANSKGIDGAGLGLYISDYFMTAMRGELGVSNGVRGLKITVALRLADKI